MLPCLFLCGFINSLTHGHISDFVGTFKDIILFICLFCETLTEREGENGLQGVYAADYEAPAQLSVNSLRNVWNGCKAKYIEKVRGQIEAAA